AMAAGGVLEGRLEKGRGPVGTVLVKQGTLRVGEIVVTGTSSGKVRAITNHLVQPVDFVAPGMAGEILGLDSVPNGGDPFNAAKNDTDAKILMEHRRIKA